MTLLTPNLMLTLSNITYYGITQFFPGVITIVFGLRFRGFAVVSGMLAGQVLVAALYFASPDLGGFNLWLISLIANAVVLFVVQALTGTTSREESVSTNKI
ncbi:hypothetical protein [uncultured Paraburkholderia sp.]|uniref:hypothetical protein n=1 Tax=uncultured Paraburkholderia sp. TaxID=1822466 RepID=UPI00338D535A